MSWIPFTAQAELPTVLIGAIGFTIMMLSFYLMIRGQRRARQRQKRSTNPPPPVAHNQRSGLDSSHASDNNPGDAATPASPQAETTRNQSFTSLGQSRRDAQQLAVELTEWSRQMNAQLDNRIIRLEQLLKEADQTIARLENTPSQPGRPNAPTRPEQRIQAAPSDHTGSADYTDYSDYAGSPGSAELATPKPPLEQPAPAAGERGSEKNGLPENELTPVKKEVIELTSQGLSPSTIARKLNRPVGEIELIISLDKGK